MGRGDNKRTLKIRKKKAQRRRKAAVRSRIKEGKQNAANKSRSAAPLSGSTTGEATIRRSGE